MDYAYLAIQEQEEEKRKKLAEQAKAYNDFLQRMKDAVSLSEDDEEIGHGSADLILCELINYLGYHEIVEEFNKVHKWYA